MVMVADRAHTRQRRWTLEEVEALPPMPGRLRELIDGELIVSPGGTVRHQSIVTELLLALGQFARAHGIGFTVGGPADVIIAEETLVQPDVLVAPLSNGTLPRDWYDMDQPLLVVEVLSPSSIRRDRIAKRALYARLGVEYWIVEPEKRLIERYLPDALEPEVNDKAIVWAPHGCPATLTIDIPALFVAALYS